MKKNLIVTNGGGATSCLSVRLHDACLFFNKNGFFPELIDSTNQFSFYQKIGKEDISSFVYGDYKKPPKSNFINFDHGYQFSWYSDVDIPLISKMAKKICPLSNQILEKCSEFSTRIINRSSVLYRGNDKIKEVKIVSYSKMLEMGLASGKTKWVVQTDELEFYAFWKNHFPDTIRIDEIPMISKNSDSYVMPTDRKEFLVNFIAALRAISMNDTLVTTTGNTGLWACIFRGNIKNVYQAWGGHEGFKMHNP